MKQYSFVEEDEDEEEENEFEGDENVGNAEQINGPEPEENASIYENFINETFSSIYIHFPIMFRSCSYKFYNRELKLFVLCYKSGSHYFQNLNIVKI